MLSTSSDDVGDDGPVESRTRYIYSIKVGIEDTDFISEAQGLGARFGQEISSPAVMVILLQRMEHMRENITSMAMRGTIRPFILCRSSFSFHPYNNSTTSMSSQA